MGYTVMDNGTDFDRGHAAGEIAERLREHDRRLEKINGSVDRMADKAEDQNTEMARFRGEITAFRGEISTVRQSLESAVTAVRDAHASKEKQADRRWARVLAVVGAVAALSTIIGLAVALAGH